MSRRIGFLFECGPDGPDVRVCRRLVALMDCGVEFVSATLGNKKNLVFQCGSVVKILLQTCQKVIIVWDLHHLHLTGTSGQNVNKLLQIAHRFFTRWIRLDL